MAHTHHDLRYNPLAWAGEYFAERMLRIDPGYTRISENAPNDAFYALIPWAYEWLWQHTIYTGEPGYTFISTYLLGVKSVALDHGPLNPL